MSSFFAELKRRNVFRVGIAYAIVAWLLIQVTSIVVPAYQAPTWVMPILITLIVIGFIIAVFVAWAYELTTEGIKHTQPIAPGNNTKHLSGRKLDFIIIGLLSLGVIFLIVDNYVLNDEASQPTTETRKTTVVANDQGQATTDLKEQTTGPASTNTPATNTIAVLPFTDISPEGDQEYFADGLTEELLNKLAQVQGLQVTARTSSFYFKGKDEDVRTIGEMLGVAHLLEGSVRKSGNRVRITAQLINAVDGNHLWSKTYDRELTDIFAIQDEIAESVTTSLSITLGAGEFNRPGNTRNIEAYDVAQKCRSEFAKVTPESLLAAIDLCEQAARLDPNFIFPLIGQWWSYEVANWYLPPEQMSGFAEKKASALERMQEIAPKSPYVLRIIATDDIDNRRWIEADRIYPSLIEEYGHADIGVNMGYATLLNTTGRLRAGLETLQRAKRIDPLSADVSQQLAFALFRLNQLDEAIVESRRGQTLGGFEEFLLASESVSLLFKGEREQAAELIARQYALEGINPNESMLRLAQLLQEDNDDALIKELQSLQNKTTSSIIVFAYAINFSSWLNQPRLALIFAQKAGLADLVPWGPGSAVRRLPEFKDFVREAGLVDYWRTTGHWADLCHPVGDDDFECE